MLRLDLFADVVDSNLVVTVYYFLIRPEIYQGQPGFQLFRPEIDCE